MQFLAGTEPDLEAWIASLPGTDPERRAFARMYLSFIIDRLKQFRGEVPGATRQQGLDPPLVWWEFHPRWWMTFTFVDRKRWFRPTRRRIVVLTVENEPPDGG